MNALQAFSYFLREAAVGLARSLRVSLLAIFTIAVSLFLSGMVLLVSKNLSRTVHEWRAEARFAVYLAPEFDAAARAALRPAIEMGRWTEGLEEITPEVARIRFERAFPSLAELVADRGEGALPFSFEARLKTVPASEMEAFTTWVEDLRSRPGVVMVDADQDWISQVETLLALIRGLGIALAAILLGASVFTIASVVRLTSFLYREEIAVMRLVGATEFYIRGPFYFEGILQGLLGGLLAVGALGGVHVLIAPRVASSLVAGALAESFLSPTELAALVLFGAIAGWTGAVVSLSRESLETPG
ncbi:MAG: FtsX-like permease family protein [Thermoanaerobaculia bacterium]